MKRNLIAGLTALLLLLSVLSACGSGGDTSMPGPDGPGTAAAQQDAALPFPDAAMDELPAPQPERQLSGQTIFFAFNGSTALKHTESAVVDGQSMRITASGDEMEYLLYRASLAGSEAVELQFNAVAAGSDCWLAIANYERGVYEFTRLADLESNTLDISDPKWHSPAGNVYFALIAYDGAQLTCGQYKVRLHSGDAVVHSLVETNGYDAFSIITLDGRPGIFYYQGAEDSLYFAHAASSTPSGSDDWVHSLVDEDDYPGLLQSAAVWNGKPLLAYSTSSGRLRLAWSESSSPTSPADWQSIELDDDNMKAQHVSLDIVYGQPALAYFRSDPQDVDLDNIMGYVYYAFHTGEDAASGWQNYWLAPSGLTSCEPSLEVVNGLPAVAFVNSKSGKLEYIAADRDNPTSTSHWTVFPTGRNGITGRIRLRDCAGVPVLMYVNAATSMVAYMWGAGPQPQTGADWMEWDSAAYANGQRNNFDLLSANGRTALVAQNRIDLVDQNGDPTQNQFAFLKRLFGYELASGNGPNTYLEFQVGKQIGAGYCATLLDGQAAVAYLDGEGSRLMFGRIEY